MTSRYVGRHRRPSASALRSQRVLAAAAIGSLAVLGTAGPTAADPGNAKSDNATTMVEPTTNAQGASPSDPDGMDNGGPDKPGYPGGRNPADQDGNNGSGNDSDCEDDNRGIDPIPRCDKQAEAAERKAAKQRQKPVRQEKKQREKPVRQDGQHADERRDGQGVATLTKTKTQTKAKAKTQPGAQVRGHEDGTDESEDTSTDTGATPVGTTGTTSGASTAVSTQVEAVAAADSAAPANESAVLGTKFGTASGQPTMRSAGSVLPTGVAAGGAGALAFTGADVATLAGAGLTALALGGMAYAAGRRQETARD